MGAESYNPAATLALGLVSPLTAKYLPDILKAALGDQATGIPMPPADAAAGIGQLQKNLGQLGALAAIALAMGAVSGELDRGTAALVLAQPVGRPAFIASKLAAIGLVLAIATGLSVAVAWVYTAILFEALPIGGWIALAFLDWLSLFAWAALTLWASAATGSTTAAAGLGFVALIALSLAAVVPTLARLLPAGLTEPAALLAAGSGGDVDMAKLASAVVGTVVVIGLATAGAMASFRRREL